jgi:hypothetical protein
MDKFLVFIDTEFTTLLESPQLISIAMVAATGEEFYAEVPYDPNRCSEFVRDTVLPLLGREPGAFRELNVLSWDVQTWLEIVRPKGETVYIAYDYISDWDLLCEACGHRLPGWIEPILIRSGEINDLLLFEYWKNNPREAPHHALYDAKANKYAFRSSAKASAAFDDLMKNRDSK